MMNGMKFLEKKMSKYRFDLNVLGTVVSIDIESETMATAREELMNRSVHEFLKDIRLGSIVEGYSSALLNEEDEPWMVGDKVE